MKKLVLLATLTLSLSALAADVGIDRVPFGSGTPGSGGVERALPVDKLDNGLLHAPQYMPSYPTAGTIWPRVVEVPCTKTGDTVRCEGYSWQPKFGRAEYLYVKPILVEAPKPVVVYKEGPTVFKEVPVKPKRE